MSAEKAKRSIRSARLRLLLAVGIGGASSATACGEGPSEPVTLIEVTAGSERSGQLSMTDEGNASNSGTTCVPSREVLGSHYVPSPDRAALTAVLRSLGVTWDRTGPIYVWPLVSLCPARVNERTFTRRVIELGRLVGSNRPLTGWIPPEIGNLSELRSIYFWHVDNLTDRIPPELGGLSNLRTLWLSSNQLTGGIPPELGGLSDLRVLRLHANQLTGGIPPELGGLSSLQELKLHANQLTGGIPPELGGLSSLRQLELYNNQLTGGIPPELGGLSHLRTLWLSNNQLTGGIPPELGGLSNLRALRLSNNQLTGEIPVELANLANLGSLDLRGNSLCEPADSAFHAWVNSLQHYWPPTCSTTFAEVFQVTQQPDLHGREEGGFVAPKALLAGRDAVLRVAPLAEEGSGDRVTRQVRVTYRGSGGVTVALIPEDKGPYDEDIPSKVDFSSLSSTFNLEIPAADVQRPNLEIWVEVWRTSSGATVADTIYKNVPVVGVPELELTLFPVLHEDPRSSTVAAADWERLDSFVKDVARQGIDHDALTFVRELLPVVQVKVNAGKGGAFTDKWNSEGILTAVDVYVQELAKTTGIRGHHMGVVAARPIDAVGAAPVGGTRSFSMIFEAGTLHKTYRETIAHELGHNLGLYHAPCTPPGTVIDDVDSAFPHPGARIGSWGYDSGTLISSTRYDLMSYCHPQWISHYNFRNLLTWRSIYADRPVAMMSSATGKVLLLWGGTKPDGTLDLKPAFVLEGVPRLPDVSGPYQITGQSFDGETLFSLSFAMTDIADGPEPVSRFLFSVPVRREWEGRLASIHLDGPGGSVTLDGDGDSSMAILTDPVTGLHGILYDLTPAEAAEFEVVRAGRNRQVHFSRGVPNELRRQP